MKTAGLLLRRFYWRGASDRPHFNDRFRPEAVIHAITGVSRESRINAYG